MTRIITMLVSAVAFAVAGSVNAMSYQISNPDLASFELLDSSTTPVFSVLEPASNGSGTYELYIYASGGGFFAYGDDSGSDFSEYSGLTTSMTNSSFQDLTTALFVTTGDGTYIGEQVTLAPEESSGLNLDFSMLYSYDDAGNLLVTSLSDSSTSNILAYGFGVYSTGNMIHATVPEPGALLLLGSGLLGLVAMRRRKSA